MSEDNLNISEVTLKLEEFAQAIRMPSGCFHTRWESAAFDYGNHMALALRTWVLTEQLGHAEEVFRYRVPASWWDHLLLDVPLLHRLVFRTFGYVPKHVTHEVTLVADTKARYPNANIAVPMLGEAVRFTTTRLKRGEKNEQ